MRDADGRRDDVISQGILIAIYIIGLIIFLPKMGYPYGDSWFYHRNVYDTLKLGRITFTDAQAATPVLQIWLGVMLCKLTGGFAFLKLNLLAYLFSFLTVVFSYRFIRLFCKPYLALLGTVLLIAMPPFFKTSLAFMTDPFFSFGMMLAFYFGARYIGISLNEEHPDVSKGSRLDAFLASVGFIIAILNRTNALLTSLAFIGFVILHRKRLKPGTVDWIIHLLPVATFAGFQLWLKLSGSEPYYLGVFVESMFVRYLFKSLTSADIIPFLLDKIASPAKWAGYFGVILLPLTLWIVIRSWHRWGGRKADKLEPRAGRLLWFILVPALIITTLILIGYPPIAIILPNTITPYGLGVKNVILPGAAPLFNTDFYTIAQLLLVIGGILFWLGATGRLIEGIGPNRGRQFIWWMLISTAVFPWLTQVFSDRYLIVLLPLVFVLLAQGTAGRGRMPRWIWAFPLILLCGIGLLANEYFGWNTARWRAVANSEVYPQLEAIGLVDSNRIGPIVEGGFEYSGFRYYNNEKFLEHYKILWEQGLQDEAWQEEESEDIPDYVTWWNLPRQFEYMVREQIPPLPAKYQVTAFPWLDVGHAEYRPFPWSKPRRLVVYRAIPDVTVKPG